MYAIGNDNLWLEESFVLGWEVRDDSVVVLTEFYLLPAHELYTAPDRRDWGCYRAGRITARNVTEAKGFPSTRYDPIWNEEAQEYQDVSEIDEVVFESGSLLLKGDGLQVQITAKEFEFQVDSTP